VKFIYGYHFIFPSYVFYFEKNNYLRISLVGSYQISDQLIIWSVRPLCGQMNFINENYKLPIYILDKLDLNK